MLLSAILISHVSTTSNIYHPKFACSTKSYTKTCCNRGSVSFYSACQYFSLTSNCNSYLQSVMSRISIELLPRLVALRLSISHLILFLNQYLRTLNTTINPVSHSSSLFTFVNSSGVFSGRPPLGGPTRSSGCSA